MAEWIHVTIYHSKKPVWNHQTVWICKMAFDPVKLFEIPEVIFEAKKLWRKRERIFYRKKVALSREVIPEVKNLEGQGPADQEQEVQDQSKLPERMQKVMLPVNQSSPAQGLTAFSKGPS